MSKSRIPIIERNSDDCKLAIGDEEIAVHVGEKVWYLPYLSTTDTLALISADDEDDENRFIEVVIPILPKVLSGWTWTHPVTGAVLGKKEGTGGTYRPTQASLRQLSIQELMFLISGFWEVMSPTENPQPDSSEQS